VHEDGRPVADPEVLARIGELAIPPAWQDVWICTDPRGHLQATGLDAAGRKQYLYHPLWRERRDQEKFRKMERFARALPELRRRVAADLRGDGVSRETVLACAVRLLDVGLFRVGSEEYAENGGGLGLATLCKEHVRIRHGTLVFDYPAKSGVRRVHTVSDPRCVEVIGALRRRRGGGPSLLAYRSGRSWIDIRSDEINDYLKAHIGDDYSAKDFRTWNATVLAAATLAGDPRARAATAKTGRKRAINLAVKAVAEMLGNTPTVARNSYIDPRVFDRYRSGATIAPALAAIVQEEPGTAGERARARVERAVLDLIE
jgi:DNA topoisomerase IB